MKDQLFISDNQPCSSQIIEARNRNGFCKPIGGLWTSTWDQDEYSSRWVDWCLDAEYGDPLNKRWFIVKPRQGLKLLIIDSLADLIKLIEKYPCKNNPLQHCKPVLDFEILAKEYDAIHLTESGQIQTHLPSSLIDMKMVDLYGWDCESTLWFRWCFDEVKEIEPLKIKKTA